MKTLIFLGVLTAFILFYVLHGRAWLKSQSWAQGFFEWVEPWEIKLWNKSETILFNRFLMFLGILPVLLEQFELFNNPVIITLLPEYLQAYITLTFTLIGIIGEINRRYTTKPLAMVAIPDNKELPREVREAVEQADAAKAEAVAVVKEAQAEGKV